MKHLDSIYIKKLSISKRKAIIAALNLTNPDHNILLQEVITNSAIKWKNKFVFTYVDSNTDNSTLEYFKLGEITHPKVIAFDFSKSRYHIDPIDYVNNTRDNLENLLNNFDKGLLRLSSGGYFDDLFYSMGIELSTEIIIIIVAIICLIVIIIISMLTVFKNDDDILTGALGKVGNVGGKTIKKVNQMKEVNEIKEVTEKEKIDKKIN